MRVKPNRGTQPITQINDTVVPALATPEVQASPVPAATPTEVKAGAFDPVVTETAAAQDLKPVSPGLEIQEYGRYYIRGALIDFNMDGLTVTAAAERPDDAVKLKTFVGKVDDAVVTITSNLADDGGESDLPLGSVEPAVTIDEVL